MIIVMKPKAADKNIKAVTQYIEANGLTAHLSQGEQVTIIGVVSDKSRLSTEILHCLQTWTESFPSRKAISSQT